MKKNVLFPRRPPSPSRRRCANRTLIMDCLGHYYRTLSSLIWLHLSYRDQYTTRRADHFSRPTIWTVAAWRVRRKTRGRRRRRRKKILTRIYNIYYIVSGNDRPNSRAVRRTYTIYIYTYTPKYGIGDEIGK